MALRLLGHIELPENRGKGGFDHADIHAPTDRLYVAHTSNDTIDVIDCADDRYIESIPGFTAVAGALVSEARGLVFTSDRRECRCPLDPGFVFGIGRGYRAPAEDRRNRGPRSHALGDLRRRARGIL